MGVASNMKKVIIRGPALSHSGYGEHTRFVLRSLRSQPDLFDIYFINVNWGGSSWIAEDTEERRWIDSLLLKTIAYNQEGGRFDISIQVTIPIEWQKIAPYNIGVTAGIETTKLSDDWVKVSMGMDKIIVISEHAKFAFDNTTVMVKDENTQKTHTLKVTTPIDIVGYPVKDTTPAPIKLDLRDEVNFLTVGTWIPRKNLENTIKWFVEEFYDQEVGLIVKTSLVKNSIRDRQVAEIRLKDLLSAYSGRKCNVYLLHGDLSEGEMVSLYQHPRVKGLINIGHGEGYGLPMFEAAYSGLPVITCGWGGQCDFLYAPAKSKNGKVKKTAMFTSVAYDIKPVQKAAIWNNVIEEGSQWCFAKEWSYKKELRNFLKTHKEAKSIAKKLQKYILSEFKEEVMYKKFCSACHTTVEDDTYLDQSIALAGAQSLI
jgi:glycosyltransferase involved in cell wall biosynthesis